jgi:cell fate (sporulation/competence/biofilm development) regulator YlbF (YheA/YmcA/DUF963 family)
MKDRIPTFIKLFDESTKRSQSKRKLYEDRRIRKVLQEYHESQLHLQELQRNLIDISKENKTEREKLKKAIIEQNALVKAKETLYNKSIGNEDLEDLEI